MPNYNALSMFSKIRTEAYKLISTELAKNGVADIVPAHGDILVFLYQQQRLSVKELAELLHRTQPTVTVLVNKLEKLGYVVRSKSREDSRITLVSLTPKGEALEPIFQAISGKLRERIYGELSLQQAEELEVLLQRIYERF
ncbi:MarR family transcriptional regulator [Gorillibacterium sp. CAU 1737]|uniref:MarR family winged helix-turn-helix transcriptional regulator n=1 Tax=Gorillibacterium sp. CAU 1737 TaxID=3140362 RepID=UPI0032611F01